MVDSDDQADTLVALPYLVRLARAGDELSIRRLIKESDYSDKPIWIEEGARRNIPDLILAAARHNEVLDWKASYEWYKRLEAVAPELLPEGKLNEVEQRILSEADSPTAQCALLNKFYAGGDKTVAWQLAQHYLEGRGTTKNEAHGYELIHEAAEQGNADAQEKLCEEYYWGKSYLPQDYKLSAQWGEAALAQGRKGLRFMIAYASSEIGKKERAKELYLELIQEENSAAAMNNYACQLSDPQEKAEWYQKAMDNGESYAYWNLGKLYRDGEGVEQDPTKAFTLISFAAKKGVRGAMDDLAIMYRDGIGTQVDGEKAIEWFEAAAKKGYDYALSSIAYMYREGKAVKQDYERAIHYYTLWAERGNIAGYYWIGNIYEHTHDRTKAIYWYRQAAAKGDTDSKKALIRLGTNWVENGILTDTL